MGFFGFLNDQSGAVTLDWVTLTAGILVAGMFAVYAIFGSGVAAFTDDLSTTMSEIGTDVDPGPVPQIQ